MILIEMKYIRYTNIHIPSHVQVLSNEEKLGFFKEYFDVEPIEFYLVNNTETEGDNFETKRQEASDLIRTIVQLRNMVNRFSF